MPLPASDPNRVWPPKELDTILPSMARWSAWWANDMDRLQAVYGGGAVPNGGTGFFASQTGGTKVHSIGRVRWFVGEAPTGAGRNTKLPIPIAAEMCQASADLLFSDPVTITVATPSTSTPVAPSVKPKATNPTQDRLDELLDDNFHSTMAEAAESDAALGGVYLRNTWDTSIAPDGPFSTMVDADQAIPEFKWGRLVAVTFWSVVHREGKNVYRHLERHEIHPETKHGVILHGLYKGEEDRLGAQVELTARTETESLAEHTDLDGVAGTIDTMSEGLAVQYVPNQTPNRMWRTHAIGRHLGRSDLDGVEHLMDQLAETMSDWMRARRVARARIMLGKELTKNLGPGKGNAVNLDQEVYETVNSLGGNNLTLEQQIQLLQPEFDPAGYKATADALIEQILQMAGYSMQTFGVNPEGGGDRTATEIEAKERRSLMTRGRKIREWTPALREHVTKMLAIDRDLFGHPNTFTDLDVEFSDGVQESQIKLGQFVQSLFASESASVEERVAILHPEWDEDQIAIEVGNIKREFPQPMADPAMTPFDLNDDNPVDE